MFNPLSQFVKYLKFFLLKLMQLSDFTEIYHFSPYSYFHLFCVTFLVCTFNFIISPNSVSATAVETVTNSVQREINKSCFHLSEIQGPGLFVHEMRLSAEFLVEMNISVYIVQTGIACQ